MREMFEAYGVPLARRQVTGMKETLLTRNQAELGEGLFDSIAWAFDQHVKEADDTRFNSAVLYGNEDSPVAIDFYTEVEPLITSKVARRWESK